MLTSPALRSIRRAVASSKTDMLRDQYEIAHYTRGLCGLSERQLARLIRKSCRDVARINMLHPYDPYGSTGPFCLPGWCLDKLCRHRALVAERLYRQTKECPLTAPTIDWDQELPVDVIDWEQEPNLS